MAWVLHVANRVQSSVGRAAERQSVDRTMLPDVLVPAGSAFVVWVRDVVTFRPIRFPSDVSHTPPFGAVCSFGHSRACCARVSFEPDRAGVVSQKSASSTAPGRDHHPVAVAGAEVRRPARAWWWVLCPEAGAVLSSRPGPAKRSFLEICETAAGAGYRGGP